MPAKLIPVAIVSCSPAGRSLPIKSSSLSLQPKQARDLNLIPELSNAATSP